LRTDKTDIFPVNTGNLTASLAESIDSPAGLLYFYIFYGFEKESMVLCCYT